MDAFDLVRPLIMRLDPEDAHRLTIRLLKMGLGAAFAGRSDPPSLRQRVLGLDFPNPLGLAAGFDKNAEVPAAMLRLGFGFVEVGSVTPRAQAGNPRPRLFRLTEDRAVINRMGFNNDGVSAVAARLASHRPSGILGINLGANKDTADRAGDYTAGLAAFAPYADYIAINVSSPNTPGLRGLQDRPALVELLGRLTGARPSDGRPLPLLLKIAPDLAPGALEDIVEVALASGIDGLIVSNTTTGGRDALKSAFAEETGGLSGRPLFALSSEVLGRAYRLAQGRLVLIGVGGVDCPRAAYRKILAGASLIQLYSALVYDGPGLVGRIKKGLADYLAADGFKTVADAVGAGL